MTIYEVEAKVHKDDRYKFFDDRLSSVVQQIDDTNNLFWDFVIQVKKQYEINQVPPEVINMLDRFSHAKDIFQGAAVTLLDKLVDDKLNGAKS